MNPKVRPGIDSAQLLNQLNLGAEYLFALLFEAEIGILLPESQERNMARTPLMADLERALELLQQVDESRLDFAPDPNVSPDIRELTGLGEYPVSSHLANLRARIEAVDKAGNKLDPRAPSEYVSKLIVTCVKLAPPSDD